MRALLNVVTSSNKALECPPPGCTTKFNNVSLTYITMFHAFTLLELLMIF
jgi:hypothetical protein